MPEDLMAQSDSPTMRGPQQPCCDRRLEALRIRFGDHVLVVAAHGSTANGFANQPVERFVEAIRSKQVFSDVIPAWLQGTTSLEEAGRRLDHRPALVLPFMTSRGYYTDKVFPRRLRSVTGNPNIHFLPPLGESTELPEIVANRLTRLLHHPSSRHVFRHVFRRVFRRESGPTVIVVGHGTRKNRHSCRSTVELAIALRRRFGWGDRESIRFAFIDQRPTLEHVALRTVTKDRVVIPFLMGLGPHVTVDLPQQMGLSRWPDHRKAPVEPRCEIHDCESGAMTILDIPVGTYAGWPERFLNRLSCQSSSEYIASVKRADGPTCGLVFDESHNKKQRRACQR